MVSKLLKHFRKDENGAAMVEYAIALLVAAALGTTLFTTMGSNAKVIAGKACESMESVDAGTDNTCP
ncbi:MAG: hypothetical protein KDK28_11915 [Maritimibacter sp.]|nr:hypothetical protein [Maritimibacter sp.]